LRLTMAESETAKKRREAESGARPVRSKQRRLISRLIRTLGKKLAEESKEAKVSVGDYIRLLQLQKDLEADEPKEIHVRWVEPEKAESEK
jgi:hypothetical protein